MNKPLKPLAVQRLETDAQGTRAQAYAELERGVRAALETYSNVHRGTGHNSMVSTQLFETAREIILDYLGLNKKRYTVVFCTPGRAEKLTTGLRAGTYQVLSSLDIGLPLGIRAVAVAKRALPKGVPFQTGGGTVKIVSPGSVIWANAPDRFEAGTPAIVNSVAFAKALQITRELGEGVFREQGNPVVQEKDFFEDDFGANGGEELLIKLRKALVGRECLVPTADGQKSYTNLDNGASTPTFAPIWDIVCRTWRLPLESQQQIVGRVRNIIASFLGAPLDEYDIIFASNTTEAVNLAAGCLRFHSDPDTQPVVLNTLLEHNSNELPWRYIPGVIQVRLPVDDEGFINLAELERVLREYNLEQVHGSQRIRVMSVSGASNVLGTFNNLRAISRVVHQYNACLLVDAAQLFAHHKVDMEKWGIDGLTFSGHKAYAPFGSGGLVIRKEYLGDDPIELAKIRASGEENFIGIAALGKAVDLLQRVGMDVVEEKERELVRRALLGLAGIDGVRIFGVKDVNSPKFQFRGSAISFSLDNVPHNLVAKLLAEQGGIGVRSGCFCSHLLVKRLLRIHPLRAFAADVGLIILPGFTSVFLPGLVRVSIGIENSEEDIDRLLGVLKEIARMPVSWIDRLIASIRNGTPFLPHTETEMKMKRFAYAAIKKVYL